MHRIQSLMGRREDHYSLSDMIEFDEGFFKTACPQNEKNNLKRGKGSQRVQNVGVIAVSTPLENGTISNHCRYFKMKILETQRAEAVNDFLQKNVTPNSIIFSDKATNYIDVDKPKSVIRN
jgi:hypothetical protein